MSIEIGAKENTEARVWNGRKSTDDIRTPRAKALDLCADVVWWHHALGSPVTLDLVMSGRRELWIASVRGDCVRRVKDKTKWPYTKIAKFFGLDHSTCIYHARRTGLMKTRTTLTCESARALMTSLRDQLIAEVPERWAIIPGQPRYSISENGLVRFDETGRIRKPQLNPNGYCFMTFQGGPSRRAVYWSVHRMVIEAFVGPCPPEHQVCHIDGNRLNNRLSNLKYGTAKENAADRDAHGRTARGVRNGNAKIRDQEVINTIRKTYAEKSATQYELARHYGISQAQINNIVLNKQHKLAAVGKPYGALNENP